MARTTILHPLDRQKLDDEQTHRIRNDQKCIQQAMKDLIAEMKASHDPNPTTCSIHSYQEFVDSLKMSDDQYLTAIRFVLHRPTVFLKRLPCEIMINNYNPLALCLWRANMDLQYVVNAYAAASYATCYMTKTDHTTSVLMESTLAKISEMPDVKIPDMIRAVGNAFVNAQEVTAQEACYLTLGLPLKVATRQSTFVNVAPADQRCALLRRSQDLQHLPANSTDVIAPSPLDHYKNRPTAMEQVCLADFVACYSSNNRATSNQPDSNPMIEADGEAEELLPISASGDTVGLPTSVGRYKLRKARGIIRWQNYDHHSNAYEYVRSIYMLFYPWRDEESEILSPTTPLADQVQCPAVHDVLYRNYKKYNKIENIYALEQHAIATMAANDDEDTIDSAARNPQGGSQQFHAVNLHDTSAQALEHTHEQMNYDILQDLEATTTQPAAPQPMINQLENCIMPEYEYHTLVNTLNIEQRRLHDHILHLIKEKAPAWQTFVSGGAGVGKSHLLKAIDQSIKRWYLRLPGRDFTKTPVIIMAPTGTAAYNVGGLTIHSALNIPPNRDLGEFEHLTFEKANTLRVTTTEVVLFILDEVSMVGNRMLHTINLRLQQLRGNSMPFGGASMLAFGDLYQLKPVMDGWIFRPLEKELARLGPHTWQHFNFYELTQVMRQRDRDFVDRLNRLRIGECPPEDEEWYRQQHMPEDSPNYDLTIPHLFLSNKKVYKHNRDFLDSVPGQSTLVPAIDHMSNQPNDAKACAAIRKRVADMDPTKTSGLHQELRLKLNVPVELTYNVNTSDGLTNGVTGTLCNWSTTKDNLVATIYILFPDNKCGKKARATHSFETHKLGIHPSWTPIQRTNVQFKIARTSTYTIHRQQFPIRVCAARTVHRVQGQSLEKALIDLGGKKQPGMHYVAISRMITKQGLQLRNFKKRDVIASHEVTTEYARLRNECTLQLKLPQLDRNSKNLIVTAMNARSLHANIDNVRSHHDVLQSNLLLITETWATSADTDDHYHIPGFNMHRLDNNTHSFDQRPHRGVMAYHKKCTFTTAHSVQHQGCDILCGIVTTRYLALNIAVVYKSPTMTMNEFLRLLENSLQTMPSAYPCIILGDFNVDIKGMNPDTALKLALTDSDHPLKALMRFMMKHALTQMLDASTVDSGMQIDHIWSNIPTRINHFAQLPFVLEAFYSDHRPIGIQIIPRD